MACGGVTALLLLLLPFSCAIIVENEVYPCCNCIMRKFMSKFQIRNDVAAFKSEMCDDKKFFGSLNNNDNDIIIKKLVHR